MRQTLHKHKSRGILQNIWLISTPKTVKVADNKQRMNNSKSPEDTKEMWPFKASNALMRASKVAQ